MSEFKLELQMIINKYSKEDKSDTPDYILATYMNDCLKAFNKAVLQRDDFYDFEPWKPAITGETLSLKEKMMKKYHKPLFL